MTLALQHDKAELARRLKELDDETDALARFLTEEQLRERQLISQARWSDERQ